jgi:NAD(P)-dependent dehydrogenase (short-subunit alcohol dehydrogenase family)
MNPGAESRVAVVTGGGQGIGKAIALRLLQEQYHVVLAELDEEAGQETEAELSEAGKVVFIRTDVGDSSSIHELFHEVERRFGGLNGLVNNAATGGFWPIEEVTPEQWNRVLAVNLTGPFLCARAAATLLRKRGGSVVNIGSTRALMSEPGGEAYGASKGGLLALTHALAISLGPSVRVNCISPGWIDVTGWKKKSARSPAALSETDHRQHPAGRVGKPEDVASAAAWLLAAENGFITGQNIVIDGGMTRKMIYL